MARWFGFIRYLFLGILLLGVLGSLALAGLVYLALDGLPDLRELESYQPPQITRVYAVDGTVLGEFGAQRRKVVPVEDIPPLVLNAFVAAEDAAFYQHGGLDLLGILRAAIKNTLSLRTRQGASTISQQLLKNVLLRDEPRLMRKIKEALLVDRLEQTLSKREILGLYVNEIYFANGIYGVAEAARFYFDKNLNQLELGEIAYLAGMINSPGHFALNRHPEAARRRQRYVLERMREEGYIDAEAFERAAQAPLVFRPPDDSHEAPYVVDAVRRALAERVEPRVLERGGLDVHTGIDPVMQREAVRALRRNLLDYDKRRGYRPLERIGPGDQSRFRERVAATTGSATHQGPPPVLAFSAEYPPRPLPSDDEENRLMEGEKPRIETPPWHTYVRRVRPEGLYYALVVEAQKDGGLIVDMGTRKGRIAYETLGWTLGPKPERATVASTFLGGQLVVVSPASGFDDPKRPPEALLPLTLEQIPLAQSAIVAIDPGDRAIRALSGGFAFHLSPYNRAVQAQRQPGSAFKPFVYLAALRGRHVTAATRLLDEPTKFPVPGQRPYEPKNYDGRFRGEVSLREALALSLNIPTVGLIATASPRAAAQLARQLGITTPLPETLSLALGAGEVGLLELVNAYAVFDAAGRHDEAWLIDRVLSGDKTLHYRRVPAPRQAITPGEATLITSLLQTAVTEGTGTRAKALGRPVAGKTGTTNDQVDAWFVGYTPDLVCGLWVGHDDRAPLGPGETGGRTALPGWVMFMQAVMKDRPMKAFPSAPDLVYTWIDPKTGQRAKGVDPSAVLEGFLPGTEPAEVTRPDPPPDDESARNSKQEF